MLDSMLMNILEYGPAQADILDFLNDRIRDFQSADIDARYILAGPAAYERLRSAMAERFGRSAGTFETYQYIPIVVDPARSDTLCVLPAPFECAKGAKLYRMDE